MEDKTKRKKVFMLKQKTKEEQKQRAWHRAKKFPSVKKQKS